MCVYNIIYNMPTNCQASLFKSYNNNIYIGGTYILYESVDANKQKHDNNPAENNIFYVVFGQGTGTRIKKKHIRYMQVRRIRLMRLETTTSLIIYRYRQYYVIGKKSPFAKNNLQTFDILYTTTKNHERNILWLAKSVVCVELILKKIPHIHFNGH